MCAVYLFISLSSFLSVYEEIEKKSSRVVLESISLIASSLTRLVRISSPLRLSLSLLHPELIIPGHVLFLSISIDICRYLFVDISMERSTETTRDLALSLAAPPSVEIYYL